MMRTRTSLLRRTVMWAAGVVLVVSVAAWVVSLWAPQWDAGSGFSLYLMWGDAIAFVPGFSDYSTFGFGDFDVPDWSLPQLDHTPSRTMILIPLWLPALIAAVAYTATFLAGRLHQRQVRLGGCHTCGYHLTGITGPCPECGSERGQQA
jgi:hypothetical protein